MATIIWDMPDVVMSGSTIKTAYIAAFTDLHEKLLQVGLIDYLDNNLNLINDKVNALNITMARNQTERINLLDIKYKLPTGNGKAIFEDVPGENYKRIVEESYDSTECYINFNFELTGLGVSSYGQVRLDQANTSIFGLTTVVTIAQDEKFTTPIVIGQNRTNTININSASKTFAQNKKICVVSLSSNFFHLMWYERQYFPNSNTTTIYSPMALKQYDVFLNIYRKNNSLFVLGRDYSLNGLSGLRPCGYGHSYMNYSSNTYFYILYEHIKVYNSSSIYLNTYQGIEFIEKILQGIEDINNKKIFNVYFNMNDLFMCDCIKRYCLGNSVDEVHNIQTYDLHVEYKGEKIKRTFYDSGILSIKNRSNNYLTTTDVSTYGTSCSFLIGLDEHTCTTNHL